MRVTMLGTGTSYPDRERVQAGVLIEKKDDAILLDIGSGVLYRLIQNGIDLDSISSIFISHFHVDHCSDFLPLCQSIWLSGNKRSLNIYGPPFLNEWLHALHERAYPYLSEKVLVRPRILQRDETITLNELTVTNTPTIHGTMDTRAFRVETEGKTLIYSSDTAPFRELNRFAENADFLIHECNWLDGLHPEGVHTSPTELAHIAEEVNAARIILTHLSPEVVNDRERVLEIVGSKTDAEVIMAEDGMSFEL